MAAAAVLLGITADSEREAKILAQSAQAKAEQSTERGIRIAAKFASRSVAFEIDRRWRILEKEASDPALRSLLTAMRQQAEPPRQDATQPSLLLWSNQRREMHSHTAKSAAWFINDQVGIQVARAPRRASIGKSYRYRDYFHGLGKDVEPHEADELTPIKAAHRSNVYISTNTQAQMVAFSVPIWDNPADPNSEVLGILAMSVELAEFSSLQLNEGQVAVLVDTNPESRTNTDAQPRRGLIVHHPHLLTLRTEESTTASEMNFYLSPHRVDQLTTLRKRRLGQARRGRLDVQDATEQSESAVVGYDDNYQDPIGRPYGGRWLAAFEPVLVHREDNVHDTGWIVIVQERYDAKSR